jgi:inorganic pyrophosphatase
VNERFWALADRLVAEGKLVIDRPRGSRHPRHPGLVYPLDYGYLEGTKAMDGAGIDVWCGTLAGRQVTGAILTIDLAKRDAEIKLLVACTREEAELAGQAHRAETQAALLIWRVAGN